MKKIESHTLHLIEEILYLLPLNLLRQYYLLLVDDQTVLHGQIVGQTGNLLYNRFVCLQQQQPQVRETEMKTEEDLKNLFLSETTHEFQNLFQEALLFLLKSKSIPLKKHVSNKNRIEKEKKIPTTKYQRNIVLCEFYSLGIWRYDDCAYSLVLLITKLS